jgi:hypothetical protein
VEEMMEVKVRFILPSEEQDKLEKQTNQGGKVKVSELVKKRHEGDSPMRNKGLPTNKFSQDVVRQAIHK